jgi:hypothetical protein
MNPDEPSTGERTEPSRAHLSRLQLLADVVVFQVKLIVDSLRDVLLSPLSIVAAVAGLLTGGDQPERYFQKVIRFGRRSEVWINLFGEHDGPGTSDHLVDPLRSKVIDQAQANPWISRAGTHLNRQLDEVNSAVARGSDQSAPPPSPPRDPS